MGYSILFSTFKLHICPSWWHISIVSRYPAVNMTVIMPTVLLDVDFPS